MLNKIIKFSLDHNLFILLAALLLIVTGTWSAKKMDIDVFPDLTAPTVVIMTDAGSLAPEEVERLVTFPIETAMNGATNVNKVRSSSQQGSSFVWVEFNGGMDIFRARQIVSEKLVSLGSVLPKDVTPVMTPQSSVMGEILFVGMQVDSGATSQTSMMDLRTLAEWVVKPAVLSTGGVSQVTIIGGDYKQYQILADPIRMHNYGVTMTDLEAVGTGLSQNSSGGIVRDYNNEYALRGVARTNDLNEMGNTFVKIHNSYAVRLSDVAQVQVGSAVKQGYASANARPAVILSISKQPNINTLKVTQAVEKNLENVKKTLPADVRLDTHIFRQADFIQASVDNVGKSLMEGAICVIVILFFFLGSFRTTLIAIIAIPLSLLGTMLCLNLLGLNINTMTLGGMCIAIGSLVDDAIIDVENVYKRLRQNHKLPPEQRDSAYNVVFHGSSEIRSSIIHATLIIMVTFVPLFFLTDLSGRMMKPLGIAYLISIFMSLVVALTVTPLLCKLLLSREKYLDKQQKDSWITAHLNVIYLRWLTWSLNHKKAILYPTFALLFVSVALIFTMGRGFLPGFNEGSLTISAVTKPGVSLEENNRIGNLIEKELLAIPEVSTTSRRTGRGELDEHSQASNSAEIDVNFHLDRRDKEAFLDDVRHRLAGIPGIATTVGQPLEHRIDHMVSGTRASIAIKIFGTDLSALYRIGNEIKDCTANIDGLVDVSVEQQTEVPQLQIRPNRDMLSYYGITMSEFNRFVELAYGGAKVCDIYEGQRTFPLVLRLNDNYTGSIENVRSSLINTTQGTTVPLSAVADVVSTGGPNTINRENGQRKLVVSANVSGKDVISVVEEIQKKVGKTISLPEGYHIEYGGQFESAESATRTLAVVFFLALIIIYLLIYTEFHNFTLSGIVLVNLPLSLIGGVLAVKLTSNMLSIPALIGFITLFGIATRNGILLISRYNNNSAGNLRQLVLQGSLDRLSPIVMTALTTALSLIPMVIAADKAGNEIQAPMAVVVLGGLLTSTLLNMFVVPIIYEWYRQRNKTQM